ncbi:hypothetical protein DPPLL_09480 [Desulfofustis limnaeus]|uniref:Uncharacterized protein n=1 Tax=Desulfofustis limnaeus TaxID=2740163 RepID=A0ABM7W6Q4_9BACT|nr:hypothetical protein DPPLL_09480 [Desulfofustis limnaeus]
MLGLSMKMGSGGGVFGKPAPVVTSNGNAVAADGRAVATLVWQACDTSVATQVCLGGNLIRGK